MTQIGVDVQIIVQTQQAGGRFICEGYSGLPTINPALIAIATVDTPNSLRWAEELRREIVNSVSSLGPSFAPASQVPVPCGGIIDTTDICHAHRVDDAQKLLVLVGDPTMAFSDLSAYEQWGSRGSSYNILPVFPMGSNIPKLLPSRLLSQRNVAFWQNSIAEVTPAVLEASGITSPDYRLFISYYRDDSQILADQLFDALSHARFDVYLDRFRTPPSVDFKHRIEQELVDKAMVLIIESENIHRSAWCAHEVATAQRQRLGILALQTPNGRPMTAIGHSRRVHLADKQFSDPPSFKKLRDSALDVLVRRIRQEHSWNLAFRRAYLHNSLKLALRSCGARGIVSGVDGLLRAESMTSTHRYAFWVTARTPDVVDFQKADTARQSPEQGTIIGPGIMEDVRRDRLEWLSQVSGIIRADEGRLNRLAQSAAEGRV